jgi:hypothetical protein
VVAVCWEDGICLFANGVLCVAPRRTLWTAGVPVRDMYSIDDSHLILNVFRRLSFYIYVSMCVVRTTDSAERSLCLFFSMGLSQSIRNKNTCHSRSLPLQSKQSTYERIYTFISGYIYHKKRKEGDGKQKYGSGQYKKNT